MEKLISGQNLHNKNKAQIKNVMIRYLHSAYYCRIYVLEYIEQTKSKIQNEKLLKIAENVHLILTEHLNTLDQLYTKFKVQPDNTYTAGIRSYVQEAMIVFLMESKTQYEKELVMLSYLDIISSINDTQIRILERMAQSLNIADGEFKMFLSNCKVIAHDLEKLTGSYLD